VSCIILCEYRTRLLADAVTGKLDVRKGAAGISDETQESNAFGETDSNWDDLLADDSDVETVAEEAEV